ncbi:heat shock protein 30C-like [Lacerta agilis]|uniref:heat shock protein 30C-like n=1 Tax=Lacerta agilis TaxID=80427 RepID=UPI00141A4CDC|nr:heat shock protein 30C-like [Lacerta agilis]
MASFSRDCRPRRALTRSSGRDACVQYVPVGMPPRSLLDQLVVDMQDHLEEMEKMRVVLVDAYPCLATRSQGRRRRSRGRKVDRRCLDDEDEDDGTSDYLYSLDVTGFEPEELSVKVEGRKLTVSAKHDKKTEGTDGCVSHEFREVRKEVLLPGDANIEALACNFSAELGCLSIEAPRLVPKSVGERTIPITILKGDAGAAKRACRGRKRNRVLPPRRKRKRNRVLPPRRKRKRNRNRVLPPRRKELPSEKGARQFLAGML